MVKGSVLRSEGQIFFLWLRLKRNIFYFLLNKEQLMYSHQNTNIINRGFMVLGLSIKTNKKICIFYNVIHIVKTKVIH